MPTTTPAKADSSDEALHKPAKAPKDGEQRVPYWEDVAEEGPVVDTTNYFSMSEYAAKALPDGVEPDPEAVIDTEAIRKEQKKLTEDRQKSQDKAAEKRRSQLGIKAKV